jgi:hypothetical protein
MYIFSFSTRNDGGVDPYRFLLVDTRKFPVMTCRERCPHRFAILMMLVLLLLHSMW